MCCLYGIADPNHALSAGQKKLLLSALATAAEARGTDATGIAYNSRGRLRIYKRPLPAHFLHFQIPEDVAVVMGHTRMTTQGSALKNRNNHPFSGYTSRQSFALAHNGVIYNDDALRRQWALPKPRIETDSFVAVQLVERQKTLSLDSLKFMAEQLRGSFSMTVLDEANTLYLVKGDRPLCLYRYPGSGLYVYASTEEILKKALSRTAIRLGKPTTVVLRKGDILRLDVDGTTAEGRFENPSLMDDLYGTPWWRYPYAGVWTPSPQLEEQGYLEDLKSVAAAFGYAPESVDALLDQGFATEEIEELLYCGEL